MAPAYAATANGEPVSVPVVNPWTSAPPQTTYPSEWNRRQTRCEIHFAFRSLNESGSAMHSHIAITPTRTDGRAPTPTSIGRSILA